MPESFSPESFPNRFVVATFATQVCALSVPCGVVPGSDTPILIGQWTGMIVTLAGLHCLEHGFDERTVMGAMGGVVASLVAFKAGNYALQLAINAILATVTGGLWLFIGAAGAVLINALLNGYFTWVIGKKVDQFFSSNHGGGLEGLARVLVSAIGTGLDVNEFKEFWSGCGLTFSVIKSWLVDC